VDVLSALAGVKFQVLGVEFHFAGRSSVSSLKFTLSEA
jgi:hypothetical protein